MLSDLATAPLGIRVDDEHEFRISIAGAQEKTAFLWNDCWCLPQGAAPTTHIFKPQLGELPNELDMIRSVENEHFCLTLCRELGLEAAESEILDFEDTRVLFQSAEAAGMQTEQAMALFHDLEQNAPEALERAVRAMPDNFPSGIYDPILETAQAKLEQIGNSA